MTENTRPGTAAASSDKAPELLGGGSVVQNILQTALLWISSTCVVLALVIGPLLFGSTDRWAYCLLAVLAYTAGAAALIYAAVARGLRRLAAPLLIPAGLALALMVVQHTPWSADVLARVSPATVSLYQEASGPGSPVAEELTPSLYPYATREAFLCFLAYMALFVAALTCARTRQDITRFALVIAFVGFIVSLEGILQSLAGSRKLYGWVPLSSGGSPFGPFVSRNQFASYAGLCFFVGLGILLARAMTMADALRQWRRRVLREASRRMPKLVLLGLAVTLTGAAVVWSLSRGALLAMLVALAALCVCLAGMKLRRDKGLYVLAILLVIGCYVSYLGWSRVEQRVGTLNATQADVSVAQRRAMFKDAWRMGRTFPALGIGAGTFMSVYPRFSTSSTDSVSPSPHNEYLHVFAEMGIPGLALALGAAVIFYVVAIRGLIVRRSLYMRCFLAGAACGVLMITAHSLVDFPMRSPAIAATVAVVAALVCAAATLPEKEGRGTGASGRAHSSRVAQPAEKAGSPAAAKDGAAPIEAPDDGDSSIGIIGALAAVGVIGGWAVLCGFALNTLHSDLQNRFIRRMCAGLTPDSTNLSPFVRNCDAWIRSHATGDATVHAALADFAQTAAKDADEPQEVLALEDEGLTARMTAARCDPINDYYHFELVSHFMTFGRRDLAWHEAEVTCRLAPANPWARTRLAECFMTFQQYDLALQFIEKAEKLASERGLTEDVGPAVEDARERLGKLTAADTAQRSGSKSDLSAAEKTPAGH